MRKYVITTDTTSDLPSSYIKEHGIGVQPLYYRLDGIVYGGDDGEDGLSPEVFYAKMRKGQLPSTMATNPDIVKKTFKKYTDQDIEVLHISFSSALSGSCNNAQIVAREICEENPNAKIIVVDSLSASLGEGLLVHKAVMLKEAGKSIEEVADWLENNKLHLCHQFTVDDLGHLHRGGRVSKTTAIIGTMINVKPILHVDNEGKLTPLSNVRGRKKSLITLVDNMEKQIVGYEDQNDIVFISHADALEDAEFVADKVRERFGIKQFMINYVSPTVGAHAGPGTIALFYMGNER